MKFGLAVALTCAVAPMFAQERLLTVDVQVIDSNSGQPIELLGPNDFELYANGQPRRVRDFHFETPPLDIVFVACGREGAPQINMDIIQDFRRGLKNVVDALRLEDRAAVLRDASEVSASQPMTGDRQKILYALQRFRKPGPERLYGAVNSAVALFPKPKGAGRRRAIVAITQDAEKGSHIGLDGLITNLFDADATLYEVVTAFAAPAVFVTDQEGPAGTARIHGEIGGGASRGGSLRPAVEATGGEWIPGDNLAARFPELIRRIRMRYVLGFITEPENERRLHTLEARLTPAARNRYPDALIRARRGYYSAPVAADEH